MSAAGACLWPKSNEVTGAQCAQWLLALTGQKCIALPAARLVCVSPIPGQRTVYVACTAPACMSTPAVGVLLTAAGLPCRRVPNRTLQVQLPHHELRCCCRLLLCSKGLCCLQEYTNYHFDVAGEALQGALDRFAQFFVDPLCKADALEREVMAVDSEFSGEPLGKHCNAAAHSCSR